MTSREREPETDSDLIAAERIGFEQLVRAIDPTAALIDCWPLTGGVSAQTTALEAEREDGSRFRLVVRAHGPRDLARDPDIARHEYQLLAALCDAGLPVPAPIAVAAPGQFLKRAAVVVEYVDGEILTEPDEPARYIAELACWLARIHDVDLESAELGFLVANDYQSPDRFEVRPDDSPLAREMCEVLRAHGLVEFSNPVVLMHGDFWRGNLLWKDGVLAAIIDWEDAMVGDPIVDLARTRMEIHLTHGSMARERFTSHYLSYRDIAVETLSYWDLAMSLGHIRAMPTWGLPPEREQEMLADMETFVQQAMEQLHLDRS